MNSNELDINKIVLLLKRNLWNILLITLLFSSVVALYAYFLKPIYSSSVTISIANEQSSKLEAVLPGQLAGLKDNDGDIQTIRLTLQSRKFLNEVVDNINVNQQFFIEKKFKQIETNEFTNLKMNIQRLDDLLYGCLFEIEPMNENSFILKIDTIDFKHTYHYGEEIVHELFTLSVVKKEKLTEKSYFFKNLDKRTLVDSIIANIQVGTISDNVVQITYNDTLPNRAKYIVEEIAKSFIIYTLDKKTTELKQTLKFLDKQIAEIKENLSSEGQKLRVYQEESGNFVSLDSSSSIYENITLKDDEIKQLTLQLHEVVMFRKNLQNNKLNTVALINSGIDTSSIQSMIELYRDEESKISEMNFQKQDITKPMTLNEPLNRLISSLDEKKRLLETLKTNFTLEHPQVLLTKEKIEENSREIYEYIISILKKSETTKSALKVQILNNLLMVQNNLNEKLNVLKIDLKEKKSLLTSLPEKDLMIQDLKRKFTLSENVYTFLLQKKMEVEMKKASTVANTQIIEDAIIPLSPIKPEKRFIVAVGLLLGLILGIVFVFLKEMLDTKVREAGTIEALTDAPLYGTLPDSANKRFFKEALRNIRTNLQFVLPTDNGCTTLLISSTVAGEGKTTIIAGLAEIIAQTDKKVLLMDLDLRKPRLYKELKLSNKVGMTNFLTGEMHFSEVIQNFGENLDFFPAGSIPPNPSELLMSSKFEKTIEELMKLYDYILFDSAPIGSVTDANMLLKHTDLLLLVVRANYAEKVYLKNFNKMRQDKNIKSAGIILNHVKLLKNRNYGYGYGYGYGYDYGYGQEKNTKDL